MAVLVNRQSASASEIFAAAIQDYGRGLIVGERTFGKGTVQNLINLDNYSRGDENKFGQLRLTVAQFFRVNGGSTQHRGVIPDIEFRRSIRTMIMGRVPWTMLFRGRAYDRLAIP